MKKIIAAIVLATVGLFAKQAAAFSAYGTVQISTNTTYAPPLQNGAVNITSATIVSVKVSSNTVLDGTTFYRGGPTNLSNSVNMTGAVTLGGAGNRVLVSSNTVLPGATFYAVGNDVRQSTTVFNGPISFNSGSGIAGTTTNDNAAAGYYAEYISSQTTGVVGISASATFQNIASITLTAGDWDINGMCYFTAGSAVPTRAQCAISTNSGNTTTDHVAGYNNTDGPPPTGVYNVSQTISRVRYSVSGATPIYLKGDEQFPSGIPQQLGTITARRVR